MTRLAFAIPLLALLGCGDDGQPAADAAPTFDAMPSASCLEAEMHDDFAWIQQKVFAASCTFSSCHNAESPTRGNLDLRATAAYAELVGVPSDELPDQILVVPGDPEASYLLKKIGEVPGEIEGELMPPGTQRICRQKREAIRRWIEAGALETPVDGGAPDAACCTADAGPVDAGAP